VLSEEDSNSGIRDEKRSSHGDYPALSVRQPWAELIITGRKPIEIRQWWTEYRGPLWIHSGLAENLELEMKFGLERPYKGGFIGLVTLTTIVRFDPERWIRWRDRHLSDGAMPSTAHGWVFRDPIRLKQPYPARGLPGLFRPRADVSANLESLLPSHSEH